MWRGRTLRVAPRSRERSRGGSCLSGIGVGQRFWGYRIPVIWMFGCACGDDLGVCAVRAGMIVSASPARRWCWGADVVAPQGLVGACLRAFSSHPFLVLLLGIRVAVKPGQSLYTRTWFYFEILPD